MHRLILYITATLLLAAGAPVFLGIDTTTKAAENTVSSQFGAAMVRAEQAIEKGDLDVAKFQIDRALERDPQSPDAWGMRARWAKASEDTDEYVYALHKQYRLLVGQGAKKNDLTPLRAMLDEVDPLATELLEFRSKFIERLLPLAERYEKEGRPHSAIRVHQEILALDPEREASRKKIEEISAAPDPTLASTAKPKDLLDGISQEWIRKHDQKHGDWKNRAKMEKPNYITETDAGYEVLIRTAEAMEQMNAFYREWFQYGTREHPGSVSRIFVKIFKDRDGYLTQGSSPVEWSAGQFTGSAVETYIQGSFPNTVGVLFHEAAHQFVALATTATGWLNEGIASFFEGTQILANGTVIMNLPANHRLFPLAARMENPNGWMTSPTDGINPSDPSGSRPEKAPTFQIIIENDYSWGPPWYAPTWGFVYFLYNYQDPVDGRFVYRAAFQEFIDSSGGRVGKGAIENFEKVVVKNPSRRTPGVDFSEHPESIRLPRTTDDLNDVWKEYILNLRDEQSGRKEVVRPYHDWALYALRRKERLVAKEHFEKGLIQSPRDVDMLADFASFLVDSENNKDRAAKLVLQAIQVLEMETDPDQERIDELEKLLLKWDSKRRDANRIREDLRTKANEIANAYYQAELYMMTMDVSLRFGREFRFTELFDLFERAARKAKKSLSIWRLAYNEVNLEGWEATGNDVFQPYGSILRSSFGVPEEGKTDYRFLTMDTITSGDFSIEAELYTEYGKNSFAGLVFGGKDASSFHSVFFFPGGTAEQTGNFDQKGYVDLTTFYGGGQFNTWRHNSVDALQPAWHKMRIDVTGSLVDVWYDGVPLVTHDFKNFEVLRGKFGLITGPGEAKFRNVRYLAREPNDPASWIERQLRMEKFSGPDASVGGSWLGRVPPLPKVEGWMQGDRTDWRDAGSVPTLIVFFSPQQNDLVPLDPWLNDLQKRYADVGLEIVAICAPDDATGPVTHERLSNYLAEHPFPGAVGLDYINPRKGGFGETLEAFGVGKYFNLPRIVLLDVNQRVIWEGDPGFELGKPWAGEESYVEVPLKDLVETRMLRRVAKWREEWTLRKEAFVDQGDFYAVMPALIEAANLPSEAGDDVAEAQQMLQAIQIAVADIDGMVERCIDDERESAIVPLLEWAEALETPVDLKEHPSARTVQKRPNAKAWEKAARIAMEAIDRAGNGDEEAQIRVAIAKLEGIKGAFPADLRDRVQSAYENGDVDRALDILSDAGQLPTRWLMEQLFATAAGT